MMGKRKKTVAFFEVTDGAGRPFDLLPWQDVIEDLSRMDAEDSRQSIFGVDHYVRVYQWNGKSHLVFAKQREEPPSSLHLKTSEIIDEETRAGQPWVEISVASFIEGTNRLGFVLGGQASPRPSSLAEWMNAHDLFKSPVKISPVVNKKILDRLDKESVEARLVTVRLTPDHLDNPTEGDDEGLYSMVKNAGREAGGEYQVELTLKVEGQARSAEHGKLHGLGKLARQLLGREASMAKVELVESDGDGKLRQETVDLVNYRLATKEKVSSIDEEGRQVRIPSAIHAIEIAAARYGDLLTGPGGVTVSA